MKELSTEQKAKAYDKTLERAKRMFSEKELNYLFPELIESDDEKIRKELIEKVKETPACIGFDNKNAVLAWLEKQGESMEINPTEFDTRLQSLIGKFDSLPKEELIGSLSFWLNVVQNNGTYKHEEKQGEQKPAKNIVEIWKDMRLEVYQQASGNRHELNYSDDTTKMFSLNDIDEIIEKMSEQKPAKWSEEDDYNAQCMIAKAANDIQNGNVGRNNELIDWLKSLRDRVQPKQVWSEEDEEIIECLNNCLDELEKENGWRFVYVNNKNVELNKIRNWLKSLKPQNHWKPTNEQMDALLFVVRNYTPKFITDKLAWNSLKTLELMYHELLLREEDYD